MNEYGDMVIELSSHTDSRGTTPYNKDLSQKRAQSAKNWIVAKGIAEERIKAVGYGESKILNRCVNGVRCSDDEHRFNRRTEFNEFIEKMCKHIDDEIDDDEARIKSVGQSAMADFEVKLNDVITEFD